VNLSQVDAKIEEIEKFMAGQRKYHPSTDIEVLKEELAGLKKYKYKFED
jgi:hypothetical protein